LVWYAGSSYHLEKYGGIGELKMNNTVKIILISAATVALSLILVLGGFLLGRTFSLPNHFPMSVAGEGPWMSQEGRCGFSSNFQRMGHQGWGEGGHHSQRWEGFADPLSLVEVEGIIEDWLDDLDQDDLVLGESMIFDNHAYAQIMEKSTGIGAMEVLIDPTTKEVYPEHGPNMMWNQKYSPMSSMHGRGWSADEGTGAEEMPVTLAEAVSAAQEYLDEYAAGREADDHGSVFYGYYTLHVEKNGEVVGMLSVNGYSGQVFYHTWHGALLDMSEH
jgi:hypothetical protein